MKLMCANWKRNDNDNDENEEKTIRIYYNGIVCR